MNYQPLEDRLIVKVNIIDKTDGGIILAGKSKIKDQVAEVLAVGPGRYDKHQLVPMRVKVGDKVLFPQYTGNKLDGDVWILRESEVLAVVG